MPPYRLFQTFCLLACPLWLGACAGINAPERVELDAPRSQLDSALSRSQSEEDSCETGSAHSCVIWLGEHGDLANCIHGLQLCVGGRLGPCLDEARLQESPDLYASLTEGHDADGDALGAATAAAR